MAAIRTVEELSMDPKLSGYYDLEEAHKQDLEDMKETGIDIGRKEIAEKMLSEKEDITKIKLYTNLAEKEIMSLK